MNRIAKVQVVEQGDGSTHYEIVLGIRVYESGSRDSYALALGRVGKALQGYAHELMMIEVVARSRPEGK